ncbi:uncharacterized protein PHALS_13734 [Plasmopara halstedii]|uniref:Uncharacterized protein n=1 Tax=Plasmopara halstedii TaxID=4781 RepID=A0A0P1APZ9_PLAHL|nr:uncharacterized protein PHALS_13734 [Plasmopara halstedii]CEG43542.1 hypothetical protein PHALS_13734 [Plasmopara halstedii]|eukprot:XP_024579911.1 hypothetical protein PHALS_13734 [Plasmopara halstedii]
MTTFDGARHSLWFIVYVVAGVGILLTLLGDAYSNAVIVCDMYPQFSFLETLWEELAMHYTRLPFLRVQVPTLHLLSAYAVIYVVKHWGLVDQGWPLFFDLLSGRWLYHQLFDSLPTHLSSVFSEPDMPELLSDDETPEVIEDETKRNHSDELTSSLVDKDTCKEALAKLMQVKLQFANRTVSRPDDWLVFDPLQEKLVLQKDVLHLNNATNDDSFGFSEQIEDRQTLECATTIDSQSKVAKEPELRL